MAGFCFSGSIPRSRMAFSRTLASTPSPVFSAAKACSVASTIFAAPKTVGAERDEFARYPLGDTFRQHLHVIRCGDERARCALQRLRNVRHLCFLCGMQHVPARAIVGIAIQL